MKARECVRSDRAPRSIAVVAAMSFAITLSVSAHAAPSGGGPPSPTDFSHCQLTDGDVEFFKALKKDTAQESTSALSGQSCASKPEDAKAFQQGFADAFEARRYLPTFGKYKIHYTSMMEIEESQRSCLEKNTKSPEARACCMQGYALGEAAFKKRLRSSEVIPTQCADDFSRGVRDGIKQCDTDCAEHPFPEAFECHAVCYSYGWNESFAPCLEKLLAAETAPHARRNRAIEFLPAYAPAKPEPKYLKSQPTQAGTAK